MQTLSLGPCAGCVCPNHRFEATEAVWEGFLEHMDCDCAGASASGTREYVKFVVAALEM